MKLIREVTLQAYYMCQICKHSDLDFEFSLVIDLIYWRDIKKTAVVFGIKLLILLFLAYHSVLSVISFFALSLLTVSLLYRIGMTVIGAVQKTGTGSPYKYVEYS